MVVTVEMVLMQMAEMGVMVGVQLLARLDRIAKILF